MKPAEVIARAFLLNGGAHLCARASCDCVAELTRIIEAERQNGARSARWQRERLRLAKPRIAEALEETRQATRRRA